MGKAFARAFRIDLVLVFHVDVIGVALDAVLVVEELPDLGGTLRHEAVQAGRRTEGKVRIAFETLGDLGHAVSVSKKRPVPLPRQPHACVCACWAGAARTVNENDKRGSTFPRAGRGLWIPRTS